MQIAYITYENVGKYVDTVSPEDEESVLLNFLKNKGLNIKEEKWTDENVNWESYSHAIIKSPWDYFDKYPEFLEWLNLMENLGIKMLNPINTIRWNSDKHYLIDIAKASLKVTASQFFETNSKPQLSEYFKIFNTNELVVKPVVSGGSKNTFRVNEENLNDAQEKLLELLQHKAFMVQPFIPEIASEGEWSFVFFDGKYSHSLIKKAKKGDFRVQHYLGGTIHPQNPSPKQLEPIQQYVNHFAKECLYARVDGVYINQEFHLMELELIEPFLFMATEPKAYENYYKALSRLIIS